jgi:TRAP-type uncharacterized transport system substrate-binding protein
MVRIRTALFAAAIAVAAAAPVKASEFINVLTGGTSGVYYPLGVALTKIYAEKIPDVRPSVQATKASVENLNLIQQGKGEIAFTLADSLAQAWEGNEDAGFKSKLGKLRAVAAIYPNYIQIVASKESGIKTLADLKGKRIGIQVGTGVHNVFLRLISKEGMKESDFRISNVRVTDMPTAMASSGTFDAVLGWDPMMQRIVQAGYGKEVISAAQIQKMAGITYPLLLVAKRDYIKDNPQAVQHFVNAYSRAHQWIRQNPDGALSIYLDAITRTGAPMDRDIVRTMMFEVDKFGGVRFIDSDDSELSGSAEFLHKNGVLSKVPDLKSITEPSFAAAADAKFK